MVASISSQSFAVCSLAQCGYAVTDELTAGPLDLVSCGQRRLSARLGDCLLRPEIDQLRVGHRVRHGDEVHRPALKPQAR